MGSNPSAKCPSGVWRAKRPPMRRRTPYSCRRDSLACSYRILLPCRRQLEGPVYQEELTNCLLLLAGPSSGLAHSRLPPVIVRERTSHRRGNHPPLKHSASRASPGARPSASAPSTYGSAGSHATRNVAGIVARIPQVPRRVDQLPIPGRLHPLRRQPSLRRRCPDDLRASHGYRQDQAGPPARAVGDRGPDGGQAQHAGGRPSRCPGDRPGRCDIAPRESPLDRHAMRRIGRGPGLGRSHVPGEGHEVGHHRLPVEAGGEVGLPTGPSPYSSGRDTKAAARPAARAAARSKLCAATIITASGARPSAAAEAR